MATRTLRAMNCDVELVSSRPDAERRFERAARWLKGFEARFSRFDPCSELSRLNAAWGRPVTVSPPMLRLVTAALSFAEASNGVFDPMVLRALESLGYGRSFEQLARGRQACGEWLGESYSWRDVSVEPAQRTITLPAGAGIDLGGIGKGWAVDRLAAILGSPCLVNAGGDVYCAGVPEDCDAWLVGVADPFEPQRDLTVLRVKDRGVATSSSLRRRWRDGIGWSHHLIDTRTWASSTSDAVQVTAVASNTLLADYHAKVALLLGIEAGLGYLNAEADVEGLIVDKAGQTCASSGLENGVSTGRIAV